MGKFRRLDIEEAQNEFPLLNEEARKALKGGCDLHQFFGGAHTLFELEEAARQERDTRMWVCDIGFVSAGFGEWHVLESASHFSVCSRHPDGYLLFGADCPDCNNEGVKYCGPHGQAYTASEPCPECPKEVYCGYHQMFYYSNSQCDSCVKDEKYDWYSTYPDGCFDHQKQEYCATCG